jgi:hypothetical protein
MKTKIQLCRAPLWLLAINTGVAVLLNGCATHDEHSFNKDYNENLATQPQYFIGKEDDHHFVIKVHQGVPAKTEDRVLDVKTAATAVAKSECDRLGWQKWHLDYIQEKDQGWMHVVIANVTREPNDQGQPQAGSQ